MHAFMNAWRRLLVAIGWAELGLGALLLTAIGVLITAQVIMRSILHMPNSWTDEAAVYAFVWMAFTGASLAFKLSRHITIQSFVDRLPERARNVVRLAIYAGIIFIATVLFFEMARATRMEFRSTTIALPVKLPRAYFFSYPLRLSLVLIAFSGLYYGVQAAIGIFKGGDLKPIMSDAFLRDPEEEAA
jgi:TRAP-type C4-dicarboxylate transport system permease small subunit